MKTLSFLCLVILGILTVYPFQETFSAEKTTFINFGATQSSSAYFPPRVAIAKIINREVPEVRVTVVESGSTNDNAMRMIEGVFQMASGAVDTARDVYWGRDRWKDKRWTKMRLFSGLSEGRLLTYVRRDAAIRSFSDITGKPINPGFMGSDAEALSMKIFSALPEIKPVIVRGTMEDSMKNLSLGKIIGMVKQSPKKVYDSGMASVHVQIPLDIVGLSKQQAEKVRTKFPEIAFSYISKGQYSESPMSGDFWVVGSINGHWVSSDIPEELVYKMIKAVYENYNEVIAAFAPAGWADPLKMVIEAAENASAEAFCPFHAGVVRYLRGKGIRVPKILIPPEYK